MDRTVIDQRGGEAWQPQARVRQPRAAANGQVVVGAIPRQPPGFQPPADLLADLDRIGAGVSVVQAVAGLRGVGTTQVAGAYARDKLAEGWRLVAWINAADAVSLLAGLAAVAEAAGLSDGGSPDPGQAVRQLLETDGERCLLVFDDVDDPEVVRPFVPAGGAATVLITTTRQPVADLGTSVPMAEFSADEALEFLDEQTGLGDEAGAAAVAADLGYLPLALAAAAAVIAGHRLRYDVYLERLRAAPGAEDRTPEQEHPSPPGVVEAVLLALESVRTSDQADACAGVMEIMAVLSPAGVRREFLHAAWDALAGRRLVSAAKVNQALELLADRSLLVFSLDGQTVVAHRLVTLIVRDDLLRRGRLAAVCRAATSVLATQADVLARSRNRAAASDIAQQLTALVASIAGTTAEADRELARVLLRLRFLALYHLIELGGNPPLGVAVGQSLTADLERVLGTQHPDTLNARNSLAAAYQAAGRAADAIPLFERTLLGRERALGPDHPDTLNSRNNLAASYQDAGRLDEAILLFELTLAARERLLGEHHLSTVNSRGNLASAYRDAGRVADAIPLLQQALSDRERLLGPDHPDTLRSGNNLANAYRKTGQVTRAIPLLEQALTDRERLLGTDHPQTLASRNNLAAAYREAGRAAEAVPLFEQTLAACERLLGADDPRTRATRSNLAVAYQEAGQAE